LLRGANWQGTPSSGEWTTIASTSRRGYTDHTMLDNLSLIHMHGRVQDPLLGRFISADPTILSEERTQAWNRYSYVENAPLSHTDPSGYTPLRMWHYFFSGQAPSDEISPWQEAWAQQTSLRFSVEGLNGSESDLTFAQFAQRLLTGFRGANGSVIVQPINSAFSLFGNRAYIQIAPGGTTDVLTCSKDGSGGCANPSMPVITGSSSARYIPIGPIFPGNPFDFMPSTAPIRGPFNSPAQTQPNAQPEPESPAARAVPSPTTCINNPQWLDANLTAVTATATAMAGSVDGDTFSSVSAARGVDPVTSARLAPAAHLIDNTDWERMARAGSRLGLALNALNVYSGFSESAEQGLYAVSDVFVGFAASRAGPYGVAGSIAFSMHGGTEAVVNDARYLLGGCVR
jgi:RHS repeat-associated protein